MILVILTALAAVCGAAKLDKSYVPPITAKTAGGSSGDLLAPLEGPNQGLPTGSYTNEVQGVVVDAANPGTRTSGQEPTGLGGPRVSYGSTDSKVGDAAFTSSLGSLGPTTRIAPGFGSFVDSDGTRSEKTSSLKFTSDVGLENYSYGFETDNGISVGENGVAADGVKAEGGYSYKGDDGKTYSVSYTADEGGYKPQGQHLPTPPPIPNEILISLEKNAKEEAAGHVDDGSYDAQKYNNEGDYSSNGASNNNGSPTIGGGDATSSGSHVSQSSQVHRPTSGVLSGAYNPGSDATHSTQGHSAQGFSQSGNKQSSFSHGTSSQDVQIENRFGVQATQSDDSQAHAQASVANTPVRSQTFNSPGASAFSSAVATGSGSSSAFASAGPSSSGFKNEYIPPFNSFGSAVQNTLSSKSDSSAGASFPAPSTATASASVSGSQTQGSGFHKYSQSSNLPSSASTSASTSGNQQSFSHSNQQVIESNSNTFPTRFGVGQQAGSFATNSGYLPPVNTVQSFGKPSSNSKPQGFDSSSAASSANIQPLSQHSSQTQLSSTHTQFSGPQPTQASSGFGSIQGPTKVPGAVLPTPFESNAQSTSVFNHQSSNQASHSSGSNVIPLSLPTPATAIPATPPFISQQQGNDNSYYYQQPSKPFITPPVNSNGQYSNNQQPIIPISTISQQGSKYPNIPASSATGQYQGTSSSSNNGITQAAVSPFTSDSSSSSTQFASQSSQFSSKPTTQLSLPSQQTSTQFGSTETHSGHKPIVQSQTQFGQPTLSFNQNSGTYQSTTQQNQGTIYQYNKPISTLPAQGHKDTSSFGQASFSQTNSQGKPGQIATGTRFGTQQSSSQFGSQSSFQQAQIGSNTQTSQFGQKPIVSSQVSGSNYQQSQVGNFGPQFGQKPQATQGSIVSSNTNTQTSFGSTTNQFGQKPQTAQGTGLTSTFGQTSFGQKPSVTTQTGSSYQQGQFGTGSQFGSKPVSTTQTGSTLQQGQFGTTGSQFGQNSQSTSGSVSTTVKPSYVQKPFGSSYQQTQVGTPSSQFGQNSQSTHSSGSTSTTSQTSFGIKPVYQQSQFGSQNSQSQTSVFGNKPFSTTQSGVTSQQNQFGSTGFQFGQNSQTAGTGFVSTTVKPVFGSTYPQSQFGSFGPQFGSKPQTTQGSSFTYNQASSQSSQFGKKPVSTIQTGVTSQHTQFGVSGSKFGQNSQTTVGSGLVSTTAKPSFSQKPFGSTTYQQGQFGSLGSQFGSKPQTTQGSSFTYNQASSQTSQFGKKLVITTQTGVTSQQNQFGSFGSQFGQNSQTTVGSGLVSTTAKPSFSQKPFGSTTYQQGQFGSVSSQFGSKPQTSQSSSFTYNQASSQTSQFGKKPVSTAQTGASSQQAQFGSSGSQFSQNSQSTQGSAVALTTTKPVAAIKPVYQQPQFGSSGSKFGQSSQSTHGFSTVTTTAKPAYGQTSFGLASQQTQFGQKPQTTQGSSFTSNTYSQSQSQFGVKPSVTGTAFPQTQFGSASSLSGQKPVTTTVTGVTSTTTPAPFGQKPSSTAQTGSYYHQSQFGSSGSQFGQKPQSTQQGSSFTSNTGSKGQVVQTSQFGVSGSSQNTGSSFQSNNISGSSSASGTNFQQTQSSGSSGSQTTQGTISQAKPVQSIQNGIKPFGSSQNTQGFTQFIATPTRFGVTPQTNVPTSTTISHPVKPTQFGQKPSQTPFGSSFGHFGQKPHASAFATNSGNNVIPFGITQVTDQVSNHQQTSQFGGQYHGVTSTQKPLLSSLSQNHYQHYQYSQNSDKSGSQSQFGQTSNSNVGSGQFGHTTFGAQSQKPFGSQSTQTTYQQTQFNQGQKPFGSSQGSTFQTGQSVVDQPTQGTSQTINIAGYNYLKPQTGFTTQHGGQASGHQDQNFQQTQSNLNSIVSTTQAPITGQSHKPFEISSSQGTFQSQSNVGSSQFGTEQIKPTQFTGPIIQTSFNQFSGQPFKPANTASTLGSTVQSQASAVSTSQFGSLHGSNVGSQTGSTLQYNVLPSHGVVLQSSKPSHFSVEPHNHGVFSTTQAPSFPTRVGSNEGLVVSTVQTPIVPVPGYEIVTSAQASSHGVAGLGEQFGGPRDPPRFDDKTGYHY